MDWQRFRRLVGGLASAITFSVCQLILGSFVLTATASAQSAEEVKSAEEVYFPGLKDLDLKIPEGCEDECGQYQRALQKDRKELADFDAKYPAYKDTAIKQAIADEKAAKLKEAQDKLKAPKEAFDKAKKPNSPTKGKVPKDVQDNFDAANGPFIKAKDENTTAANDLKAAKAKLPKEKSLERENADKALARIREHIQEDIDKLQNCIKTCVPKKKPPVVGGDGPVVPPPQPPGPAKAALNLPPVPDCTQPNFEGENGTKEAFYKQLDALLKPINAELSGKNPGTKQAQLNEMDKNDPNYTNISLRKKLIS